MRWNLAEASSVGRVPKGCSAYQSFVRNRNASSCVPFCLRQLWALVAPDQPFQIIPRMASTEAQALRRGGGSAAELLKVMAPHMNIECRGEIPIKGKGTMTTYWVNEGTAAAQTNTASSDEVAIQIA